MLPTFGNETSEQSERVQFLPQEAKFKMFKM